MDNNLNHLIDEYLLGNLTGDELALFEKKLNDNPSLQAALAEQKLIMAAVDTIGDVRMAKRIKKIHEQAKRNSPLVRRMPLSVLAIAATVTAILGLCVWIWLRPPLHERLFASYYEPYAVSFSNRSNDIDIKLLEASRFYKNGDFSSAAPLFEEALTNNSVKDDKALLAAGICYMEMGNDNKALGYFTYIIELKDSPFSDQAQWYAGLTELRKGDVAACKSFLDTLLLNPNGFYFEKAKELYGELK